jgi:hypothetical protein
MDFAAQLARFWDAIPFAPRRALILVSALIFLAASARAQQLAPAVGNIEGDDVSIAASASAISVPQDARSPSPIRNGGVVTVGSGQARLMLTSGGELDFCGPAKLTLLQSRDAVTVALDFGTVRLQLPASTSLRVFTPTMIATPLEIDGVPGDVTVRVEQDDSLCVRAASGALLLESQFTNEKIVVPQAGQFFFAQGRLVPVANTGEQQCECVLNEARFVVPPSPTPAQSLADMAPAEIASAAKQASAPQPADARKPGTDKHPDEPSVEYSVLAHPNDARPVSPQPNAAPTRPQELMPVYKIDMPPLVFSASSPVPPPAPAEDMILLIRTTEINPDFEFTGHVDAPRIEPQEETPAHGAKSSRGRQPKIAGAKPGFWARLKRFFVGSSS